MKTYLNGQLVDSSDAKISLFDEGLLHGYGVYETLRTYQGKAFRKKEHLLRLQQSAREVGLQAPETAALESALEQTIRSNGLKDAGVRMVLTAGAQSDWGSAPPSLIVMARALSTVAASFKAVTVRFHRDLAKAKTLNCLTSVMARRVAVAHGVDEALFSLDGNVLEGTTSNLFLVQHGALYTPQKHVLEGITANQVKTLARQRGVAVHEEPVSIERLYRADEAFLTSTLKEIVPLVQVDGKAIPQGPVTKQVQVAFSEMVAREIQG